MTKRNPTIAKGPLDKPTQAMLERILARHGQEKTARLIGCATHTIETARGGPMMAHTRARLTESIARVHAELDACG